jgi:dihydroorotase
MAGDKGDRGDSGAGAAGAASLVVRGGEVFDPVGGRFDRLDILVTDGKVARMAPTVETPTGVEVLDATGLLVTPGLVDCHVHAFRWGHLISLDVDPISSHSGVTTFVDGGSAGSLHFMAFRRFVMDHVRSNLYALLNVSALGETVDGLKGVDAWENDDLRFLHLDSAVETVEKNRDRIVGIKVRIHTGLASLLPMAAARALADAVGLPLVVHVMKAPPLFSDLLPYLKAGDVVTHMYHPGPGCLVDRHDRIAPEYVEARKRGVLFDTGTARFHTSHPVARAAIAEGFLPDTISTDLCLTNYQHITIDMPTTLTKFMALGLSLEQVLQKATIEPAKSLPAVRGHGRLAEGLSADIALLAVESGEFTYEDFFGNRLRADRRLICRSTIKDGRLLTPEEQEPMSLSFMRR